jgi:hypothetical protein
MRVELSNARKQNDSTWKRDNKELYPFQVSKYFEIMDDRHVIDWAALLKVTKILVSL